MSLVPQVKEPKLYITDTMFENVPVRIYQPKKTTPGLRKGLLFIHGGSGMFGCKSKIFHIILTFLFKIHIEKIYLKSISIMGKVREEERKRMGFPELGTCIAMHLNHHATSIFAGCPNNLSTKA